MTSAVPRVESSTESVASAAEMAAAAATEGTPALGVESAPDTEANDGSREEKDNGRPETEPEEPGCSVEPKMDAEAGEEHPAAAADKAASEAGTEGIAVTVNQEATSAPEEPELKAETQQSLGDDSGSTEPASDSTTKEAKEEPGEESRFTGTDCEKSKAVCEDTGKPSGGGGELGGKRRPSVEMSSSDGEPLSRLDSEDRWVGEMSGCLCPVLGGEPFFSTS